MFLCFLYQSVSNMEVLQYLLISSKQLNVSVFCINLYQIWRYYSTWWYLLNNKTVECFVTKLGIVMSWCVLRKDCFVIFMVKVTGFICIQNITSSTVSSEMLILFRTKLSVIGYHYNVNLMSFERTELLCSRSGS